MSTALPALDIRPPEQQDILGQYGKLMALRNLQQQQQLGATQLQGEQQKNEVQALQLKDMQTLRQLSPQFIQKDDTGKPTGYDFEGLSKAAIGAGVNPATVNQLRLQNAQATSALAEADTKTRANQDDLNKHLYQTLEGLRSVTDPAQKQQIYSQGIAKAAKAGVNVSQFPPQYPGDEALPGMEASIGMHSQILADAKEAAATKESEAKAASENASAALTNIKVNLSKNSKPGDFDAQIDAITGKTPSNQALNLRTKAMVNFALGRGDIESANAAIKQAADQIGVIEKETNPQVQAGKIAVAAAEAKASQLIAGIAKPVYAFNPQTNQRELMSATDAIQKGIRVMTPVSDKEVSDDIMLNNRLGDVHQKIARYEQALQQPISDKDKGNIAALIGVDKAKLGAFGTEIPLDRLNAALDSENVKNLSGPARDALIAYRNAQESLIGYNRVLSGSGRSNEQALQLQMQTLPNPATTDLDYSKRALSQFKENLGVVGQGLPRIPGVKSPTEIEQQVNESQPQQPQHIPGGQAQGLKEGATGTGTDGNKYVVKDGKWVLQGK